MGGGGGGWENLAKITLVSKMKKLNKKREPGPCSRQSFKAKKQVAGGGGRNGEGGGGRSFTNRLLFSCAQVLPNCKLQSLCGLCPTQMCSESTVILRPHRPNASLVQDQ